jgi:hypothetical protein
LRAAQSRDQLSGAPLAITQQVEGLSAVVDGLRMNAATN